MALGYSSYYIQRLVAPPPTPQESVYMKVMSKVHLTEQDWDGLTQAFGFDYMGSAEFEFDWPQRCLDLMKQLHTDLITRRITIHRDNISPARYRPARPLPETVTVYIICYRPDLEDVETRIRDIAKGERRFKEDPLFGSYPDFNLKGWWDIRNGFFFFVDQAAFAKTCEFFQVNPMEHAFAATPKELGQAAVEAAKKS